jgi:hypothetical protein
MATDGHELSTTIYIYFILFYFAKLLVFTFYHVILHPYRSNGATDKGAKKMNTIPQIGEVFAAKGTQDLIYMGDYILVVNVDTKVETRVEITEAMSKQLPVQYAKYCAGKDKPGTMMGRAR